MYILIILNVHVLNKIQLDIDIVIIYLYMENVYLLEHV